MYTTIHTYPLFFLLYEFKFMVNKEITILEHTHYLEQERLKMQAVERFLNTFTSFDRKACDQLL